MAVEVAVNQPKGTKNESNSQPTRDSHGTRPTAVNQPKGTKNESNSQLAVTSSSDLTDEL